MPLVPAHYPRILCFSLLLIFAIAVARTGVCDEIRNAALLGPDKGGILGRIAYGVDGMESSHGTDPLMWHIEPSGPQGPMQISAAAAADVGGGDRFDDTQNRALGRAYLARLYHRYLSWPDAIAAYNWGLGHMDNWIVDGRPVEKFPTTVQRYRARVLMNSGFTGSPSGGTAAAAPINPRQSRLEMLRLEAGRQMAERRHRAKSLDAVELLYVEIMRATAPSLR